jgi:hypothetical protein
LLEGILVDGKTVVGGLWRMIGRTAFAICLSIGLVCIGYAMYIYFAWPVPPTDPDTAELSWISENSVSALVVAWLGLAVIAAGWMVRLIIEKADEPPE